MEIRPRMSQHEGREAKTIELSIKELSSEQVELLAKELLLKQLEKEGFVEMSTVNQVISSLNAKYKAKALLSKVLDLLEKKGIKIDAKGISIPGFKKSEEKELKIEEKEKVVEELKTVKKEKPSETVKEVLSFPVRVNEQQARKIASNFKKKRFFGLLGSIERISSIQLVFQPIYKVFFNEFNERGEFFDRTCFVNAMTGELIHFIKQCFVESNGFTRLTGLNREEIEVLKHLTEKKTLPEKIKGDWDYSEEKVKKLLNKLVEKGFLEKEVKEKKAYYFLKKGVDLPPSASHPLLKSLEDIPLKQVSEINALIEKPLISEEMTARLLKQLFSNIVIKKIETIYRPVYKTILEQENGEKRSILIDAFLGRKI
jgi:predicted transcriptional regulator/DNA-binding winged helix-turn-helix (wHTH) protein